MVRAMTTNPKPKAPANPGPFGEIDNKDLADAPDLEIKTDGDVPDVPEVTPPESVGTEPPEPFVPYVEPPVSDEPAPAVVMVEMIHHDALNGVNLIPGDVYELPAAFAETLITGLRAKLVA